MHRSAAFLHQPHRPAYQSSSSPWRWQEHHSLFHHPQIVTLPPVLSPNSGSGGTFRGRESSRHCFGPMIPAGPQPQLICSLVSIPTDTVSWYWPRPPWSRRRQFASLLNPPSLAVFSASLKHSIEMPRFLVVSAPRAEPSQHSRLLHLSRDGSMAALRYSHFSFPVCFRQSSSSPQHLHDVCAPTSISSKYDRRCQL